MKIHIVIRALSHNITATAFTDRDRAMEYTLESIHRAWLEYLYHQKDIASGTNKEIDKVLQAIEDMVTYKRMYQSGWEKQLNMNNYIYLHDLSEFFKYEIQEIEINQEGVN